MLCELMTAVQSITNRCGKRGRRWWLSSPSHWKHRQIYRRACFKCACAFWLCEAGKIDSRMLIWCSFWIRTSHLVRILESRGHFSFIAHPPSIACRFCRPIMMVHAYGFVHSIYLLLSLATLSALSDCQFLTCLLVLCSESYDRFTCEWTQNDAVWKWQFFLLPFSLPLLSWEMATLYTKYYINSDHVLQREK